MQTGQRNKRWGGNERSVMLLVTGVTRTRCDNMLTPFSRNHQCWNMFSRGLWRTPTQKIRSIRRFISCRLVNFLHKFLPFLHQFIVEMFLFMWRATTSKSEQLSGSFSCSITRMQPRFNSYSVMLSWRKQTRSRHWSLLHVLGSFYKSEACLFLFKCTNISQSKFVIHNISCYKLFLTNAFKKWRGHETDADTFDLGD